MSETTACRRGMKVAVFLGDYSPSIGGGYTFQQEILRAIESHGPDSGHDFVFFLPRTSGSPASPATGRFRFVHYEEYRHRGRFYRLCRSSIAFAAAALSRRMPSAFLDRVAEPLSSLIRAEAIDMIWSVTPACPSTEAPYITTVWDLEHRKQPYFPEVGIKDEWEARELGYSSLLKRAACVVTGTTAGMLEIAGFYHLPAERIRVLPFPAPRFDGQDSPADDAALLQRYGVPGRYLFYPAQFWPHKNHYGVLRSLLALKEKHGVTLPVVFVGSDKGNLAYLQQAVREFGLNEQVHFLGFVPREHLPALYRRATALLFLSYFGPDNLPPLEAFALGCPVIASGVSGAHEQLGDAALLVDPKDPEDVADAIHRLLHDETLRRSLVSRGVQRASLLTGERYFKGICSILDGFVNIRRSWSSSDTFRLVR